MFKGVQGIGILVLVQHTQKVFVNHLTCDITRLQKSHRACTFSTVLRQVCLKINSLSHGLVGYGTQKGYISPYSTCACVVTNIIGALLYIWLDVEHGGTHELCLYCVLGISGIFFFWGGESLLTRLHVCLSEHLEMHFNFLSCSGGQPV